MVPTTQNDANREEMDRYVDAADCDYMIDLQTVRARTDVVCNHSKHKFSLASNNAIGA